MLVLFAILLCLAAQLEASCDDPTNNMVSCDQELVLAVVINRHGERSPDADELSLAEDQERIKKLIYIEGLEGLTNVGKRSAFQIGHFIRNRYGDQHRLISKKYFGSEIAIRSTDKERTKMTIQVAMAAAYPPEPEQQWDEDLGLIWQPVPYSNVPLSEDYLRYYSNCQRFKELMAEAKKASLQEELKPYLDLVPLIKENTGRDFTEDPLLFETLFDLFRSLGGLGLDIPRWAQPHEQRLAEAALLAYRLYYRNEEMKKIGGGVILNLFTELAEDIAAGKAVSQRLRVFSAHDFNLGSLMEVTGLAGNFTIPEYAAVFALELYKSKRGEFSVVPVYLHKAGKTQEAQALRFSECKASAYCNFQIFKDFTKEFRLPEKEYYRICNIRTEL